MKIGKTADKLSIAVIIDKISWEQLVILNKHFEYLPQRPNVLLLKKIPCLPVAFYQLREILLLEKHMHKAAKEELYKAGSAFNIPVMRKVFQGSTAMHVFQTLPDVNHLIGNGLDKYRFFIGSRHPSFIGSLRRWVEHHAVDKNLGDLDFEKNITNLLKNDPGFSSQKKLTLNSSKLYRNEQAKQAVDHASTEQFSKRCVMSAVSSKF